MHTVTDAVWKLRGAVSPEQRKRLRRAADSILLPVGSIVRGRPGRPYCSLTFDDGPDPVWTSPLLDLLQCRGMRATFFLLTKQTRQFPELVNEIVAGGHEVALHGDDHARLTGLSLGEVRRRMRSAKAELELTVGRSVRLFRPPFGAQTVSTYLIARSMGMNVVVWGPHASDWLEGTPEEVAERGLIGMKPGEILLLHDGLELPEGDVVPTFNRLSMFERVLDGLADRGLTSVSVSELAALNGIKKTAWFRP